MGNTNGEYRVGFVALLDVLGFTSLVHGEDSAGPLRTYQTILQELLESSKNGVVSAVAFSDSIVLTIDGITNADFLVLALFCSQLFGDLLAAGIPVRGAISAGTFLRATMGNSVFVAGKPIIDAYQYEQKQNWVGVMVSPSAYKQLIDLEKMIAIPIHLNDLSSREDFKLRFHWAASIQPAPIPFHGSQLEYRGFAIVPRPALFSEKTDDAIAAWAATCRGVVALQELQAIAPDPEAQLKYQKAVNWLDDISSKWLPLASQLRQHPVVD